MRTFVAVAVIVGLGALAQPVGAAEDCAVTLEIMDKVIWTVKVTADGISGDDNSLRCEDGVIFGYIGGKQVRLRFEEAGGRGTGSIGGGVLHFTKGEGTLDINGFSGGLRFNVKVSGAGLVLGSERLLLKFARQQAPDPSGRVILLDEGGHVRLRFAACAWSQLPLRPELGILLQHNVLRRVGEFEDLDKGLRLPSHGQSESAASSPGSGTPRTPPPPSGSRPPSPR